MLPKKFRLPGHQIPVLVKQGKRITSDIATLISQRTQNNTSQFAFIVPSRLSKKSHERNRTKRLLSEVLRLNMNKINPGFEIILMAKKILTKEKLQEIQPEINKLLEKAGLT